MKRMLIVVLAVVILAGIAIAMNKDDNKNDSAGNNTGSTAEQNATTQPADDTDKGSVQTITYINGGFSPEKLTTKAGENVVIENKSNQVIQFSSDDHPEHTDNSELNVGNVQPGEKKTFVLTRLGTYGFHDHLNPSATGEIVVQ